MHERNCNITAKHIYVIVNENRNRYKNLLLQHYNIITDCQLEKNINNTSIFEDTINASVFSIFTYLKEFNFVISADKWQMMKPVKKLHNNRVYWVLKSGWTDIIAEKLWQQQKLVCVFKFKKHNVYLSTEARYYISFYGSCAECAATITCILLRMPSDDTDVIFQCTVENICSAKHITNKKRHVKGKRRALIADKMIEQRKDAISFRREEAKRLKQFGDKDPPILPSSTVLRKAKEERLLQQHGLIFSNPVLNLLNNAKHSKYIGSIINISLLLFFVCIGPLNNKYCIWQDIKKIQRHS